MLKSCPYCGRIHDSRQICTPALKARRDRQRKGNSRIDKFHSSQRWTDKSLYIRERDHFLCQACLLGLDGKGVRYTDDNLSVHHIVPLSEAWDMRLDDDNLITLCQDHHEAAEAGRLPREVLIESIYHRGCGEVG